MASDEKLSSILSFYKLIDMAEMEIEENLDSWLQGSGTDKIRKTLLHIARLSTQLLWDELYEKPTC